MNCPPHPHNIRSWLRTPDAQSLSLDMRNVLWVATSPNLLKAPLDDTEFAQINISPEQLEALLTPEAQLALDNILGQTRSHFLGAYYETIWSFLLKQSTRYQLLAQNFQIHESGTTLGEFDFLVWDKQRHIHLHQEIAIKFYLYHPDKHPAHWLGPNARDRLDLKIRKLSLQQLRLSEHPLAKTSLEQLGIKQTKSQMKLQGTLFYPSNAALPPDTHSLNAHHERGHWYHPSTFLTYLREAQTRYPQHRWQILTQKSRWLAPRLESRREKMCSYQELQDTVEQKTNEPFKPLLVVRLTEIEGVWIEQERLFVVPATWPAAAKSAPAL